MTRSTDFDATVKHGKRAVQPDLVIYMRRATGDPEAWTDRFSIGRIGRATPSTVPAAAPCGARRDGRMQPVGARRDPCAAQQSRCRLRQVGRGAAGRLAAYRCGGVQAVNDITSRCARSVRRAESTVIRGLIFVIQLYRHMVSPLRLPTCRFTPTCSQYAVDALAQFGLVRGSWLATVRLAKCGPWHRGGWDPVPERRGAGVQDWVAPATLGESDSVVL